MMSTERAMIGTGSMPASAIRPAKTEMYDGAPSFTAAVISSTWAVVNRAVTLTLTPSSDSSRTSGAIDSPRGRRDRDLDVDVVAPRGDQVAPGGASPRRRLRTPRRRSGAA